MNRARLYSKRSSDWSIIEDVFSAFSPSKLCNDNCIILVWITNNPVCMEYVLYPLLVLFISSRFFAEKDITHTATAYWVKVTSKGDPLVPLSCSSRETYLVYLVFYLRFERVVIGQYSQRLTDTSKRQCIDTKSLLWSCAHEVKQLSGESKGRSCPICVHHCEVEKIPFIISTVSFHSRKPNCEQFSFLHVLIPGLTHSHRPSPFRGLELFARQLRPHWYSVGNEVLLFQSSRMFEDCANQEE